MTIVSLFLKVYDYSSSFQQLMFVKEHFRYFFNVIRDVRIRKCKHTVPRINYRISALFLKSIVEKYHVSLIHLQKYFSSVVMHPSCRETQIVLQEHDLM
jgi:hypothetical protein